MAIISKLDDSSTKAETSLQPEAVARLPGNFLCNYCYLPPKSETSFSCHCHCYEVLSPAQCIDATIESPKEFNELLPQLNSENLPIDLTIILSYQAHRLDSDLLNALGNLLLSKNIRSLHLHINYIYSQHKNEDTEWQHVVKDFARALEKNATLKTLNLSGTHVTFIMDLVVALQRNKSLLSLNLSGVAVGGYPDEAQGIKQALNVYVSLETLNLSGNYIKSFDLAPAFKKNPTLTSLDLSDNLISEDGVVEIAHALEICRTLRSLNLAKNKLSPSNVSGLSEAGLRALGQALGKNPALESLDLSHNSIDTSGAVHLALGMKTNTNLQSLDLSNNSQIGDEGAKAFGELLHLNRSLMRLNLSHSGMGDQGVEAIAQALELNTSLQILNLAGNSGNGSFSSVIDANAAIVFNKTSGIGNRGAQALARGLERNRGLQLLDLGGCSIDTEGMLAIAQSLNHHTAIRSLILNSNGINNGVAKIIASLLEANHAVRTLSLQSCFIGDEGASLIAYALSKNTNLIYLDIRNNSFSYTGIMAFAGILAKNTTLRSLYLGGKFEETGVMAIMKALATNARLTDKVQDFDISWCTVFSSWDETRWDSELTCQQGTWSYIINGETIASADSFSSFWYQIKDSKILPLELNWLRDIVVLESSKKMEKTSIITTIGKKLLSSSPPLPRGRYRSSSTRTFPCVIV
jgi:Ran GTPase-activating protein (RanGAP) involved in mRNA processing and transport